MSIEKALADLQAAIEANTAAVLGKAGAAAETTTVKTTKTEATAKPGKTTKVVKEGPSREEMQALLTRVKEEKDAATAKGLIKKFGKVEKMAEIGEDRIEAVFNAAKALLEAETEEEEADEEEGM
jgi:hypothetical protein